MLCLTECLSTALMIYLNQNKVELRVSKKYIYLRYIAQILLLEFVRYFYAVSTKIIQSEVVRSFPVWYNITD